MEYPRGDPECRGLIAPGGPIPKGEADLEHVLSQGDPPWYRAPLDAREEAGEEAGDAGDVGDAGEEAGDVRGDAREVEMGETCSVQSNGRGQVASRAARPGGKGPRRTSRDDSTWDDFIDVGRASAGTAAGASSASASSSSSNSERGRGREGGRGGAREGRGSTRAPRRGRRSTASARARGLVQRWGGDGGRDLRSEG